MPFALRRHPRSPVKAPLEFTGDDPRQVIFGFVRDLSVGGVLVETEFPVPPGSRVTVHMMLPGVPDETIVVGHVRWWRTRAMGVGFVGLDPHDARTIAGVVAQVADRASGAIGVDETIATTPAARRSA
ncbi:MAG TPA: PilZ domain-containing protein [Polyangiaceae bacterium]|nr:PilZ domain-containing protein [Polyangiaceae bacterium]